MGESEGKTSPFECGFIVFSLSWSGAI